MSGGVLFRAYRQSLEALSGHEGDLAGQRGARRLADSACACGIALVVAVLVAGLRAGQCSVSIGAACGNAARLDAGKPDDAGFRSDGHPVVYCRIDPDSAHCGPATGTDACSHKGCARDSLSGVPDIGQRGDVRLAMLHWKQATIPYARVAIGQLSKGSACGAGWQEG